MQNKRLSATTLLTLGLVSSSLAMGSEEERCAALNGHAADGYSVYEARFIPASTVAADERRFEDEAELPNHCLVRGSLGKRTGIGPEGSERAYEVRFELRMPVDWNSRFVFEGGGVMDGVDWPAYGSLFGLLSPNALSRGFAVVRTNSGHESPNLDSSDGSFSYDQQAKIDYAFNALDKVSIAAKAVVTKYYGRSADYSYFMGCSNGGRQGMLVSQRYPLYFDGVISGNASFNISSLAPRMVWSIAQLREIAPKDAQGNSVLSKAFTDAELNLIGDAVLKQCDSLDGLRDGLIGDLRGCEFTPGELRCDHEDTEACIPEAKLEVLEALMNGPRGKDGKLLYQPIPYDSGFAESFRANFLGNSEGPNGNGVIETLGLGTYRYHSLTPPDPTFDPDGAGIEELRKLAAETRQMNDADSTLMSTFAQNGKLLMYHGAGDFSLSAFEIIRWYESLARSNPNSDVQNWARLFVVPGMGHCGGGRSFNQFDPLEAIVDWVENDNAPMKLPATSSDFPGERRPICAWPKVSKYKPGAGPDRYDQFVCE